MTKPIRYPLASLFVAVEFVFVTTFIFVVTYPFAPTWAEEPLGKRQTIADDHSDETVKWWKGNLHTHSLWSDGDDFPEMIAKWYRDEEYHFLSLTDHNILSTGQRWMDEAKIVGRGGETVIPKYLDAWGDDWVETRLHRNNENEDEIKQFRLRPLAEFRSKLESPGQFLMIQGEEISDRSENVPVHMNATNLSSVIQPIGGATVQEAINNNLRAAEEHAQRNQQPILVHLNHPNFGWAISAEDLAATTNERFLEVYNGHPGVNHLGDDTRPGVETMWDIANTIRIGEMGAAPMYGLATDDCHKYHGKKGSRPGRGWIMVRAEKLEPSALLTAMQEGDFYCSSGVTLSEVKFDSSNRIVSLSIEPTKDATYTTRFIGTRKDYERKSVPRLAPDGKPMRATRVYSQDIGQVLATDTSLTPSYQLKGDELYVRAEVTSSLDHPDPSFKDQKKQAWTQPVGWEEK